MKTLWIIIKTLFITALLPLLTQVGGLIYLLFQPFSYWIRSKVKNQWQQKGLRYAGFVFFYLAAILFVIPPLARQNGRVPLPWFSTKSAPIKAHNILVSPLLMRNYVNPKLKAVVLDAANVLAKQDPDFEINYLDGNFPFINGFPLLPHLSHDDGEKLDLSFVYTKQSNGKLAKRANGWLGYGVCVGPEKGETNMPTICANKGNWQYNFIEQLMPDYKRSDVQFDPKRSKVLIQQLARDKRVGKIFIEVHLEERLGLSRYQKVRQAGCHSVRHDDHIHLQL